MTDTHTTAHIPDEAVQAGALALRYSGSDTLTDMAKTVLTAALPHLSAPCAVEVDKLHWDGLVGFVGSFSYVVAPPSFTKGWRVWGKLSDKSASVGGVLITTTATDEEEAKAAAQADFERRILSCVVTKPVDALTAAEAVYGLLGWLTSRNETVVLGASHGAAIGAELADAFCKKNNLGDCRDNYHEYLNHPTITADQPVDVAAVREAEAVIERNGEELTASLLIGFIAQVLREKGKAVLTATDNSLGKQILEFKVAADNIRAMKGQQHDK